MGTSSEAFDDPAGAFAAPAAALGGPPAGFGVAAGALEGPAAALEASAGILGGAVVWLDVGLVVGEMGGVVTKLAKAVEACNTAVPEEVAGPALPADALGRLGLTGVTIGPGDWARTRTLCTLA